MPNMNPLYDEIDKRIKMTTSNKFEKFRKCSMWGCSRMLIDRIGSHKHCSTEHTWAMYELFKAGQR